MRIFETAHDHRVLPGLFMISIDMAMR
jgi:hypothetical protein